MLTVEINLIIFDESMNPVNVFKMLEKFLSQFPRARGDVYDFRLSQVMHKNQQYHISNNMKTEKSTKSLHFSNFSLFTIQQVFFTAGILTRHSGKSTGATHNINEG